LHLFKSLIPMLLILIIYKIEGEIMKKIKEIILLAIWVIIYVSIGDNFPKGSNKRIIAYIIMWVFVILYAVIKAIKKVKHLNNNR
jgi:hypothetical protein